MDFAFNCLKNVFKYRRKARASKGQMGIPAWSRDYWRASTETMRVKKVKQQEVQVNKRRKQNVKLYGKCE